MSATLLAPVPAQATQPDELVIGKSGDPDTLDPAVTVTNNSWTATYPAYERLLKFKVVDGKGSTEVEGDVAKSWTRQRRRQDLDLHAGRRPCLRRRHAGQRRRRQVQLRAA